MRVGGANDETGAEYSTADYGTEALESGYAGECDGATGRAATRRNGGAHCSGAWGGRARCGGARSATGDGSTTRMARISSSAENRGKREQWGYH